MAGPKNSHEAPQKTPFPGQKCIIVKEITQSLLQTEEYFLWNCQSQNKLEGKNVNDRPQSASLSLALRSQERHDGEAERTTFGPRVRAEDTAQWHAGRNSRVQVCGGETQPCELTPCLRLGPGPQTTVHSLLWGLSGDICWPFLFKLGKCKSIRFLDSKSP